MFKLNAKSEAYSFLYSLSHFESNGHTVHMLTQQYPPPPLTSTMKSSLFMYVHSSPFSLAASLHQCRAKHSCYINNAGLFLDRPCIRRSLEKSQAQVNALSLWGCGTCMCSLIKKLIKWHYSRVLIKLDLQAHSPAPP